MALANANHNNLLTAKNDFSLVIFGASGHLAQLKIFPALYFLALKKRLPSHYAIVGFARSAMDDGSFRTHVAEAIRRHVEAVNEGVLAELLTHVFYRQGQYDDVGAYSTLATRLTEIENGFADDAVRLCYLSIPPTSFGVVGKNICAGGVHASGRSFRVIVEKPFGSDYKSAKEIQQSLVGCFAPDEIYLLDHYLGKEAARNIYYLRLVNPIVERILKYTLVTNVQITAAETVGLEGRAGYFEQVGTLRDMFQSHMLSLMALLTMQLVPREDLPRARLDALKNIYVPPAADLSGILLQGQYARSAQNHSYRDEEGVAADSRTNTFAALKLMTRVPRWQGTPFYLRSGKCLKAKETKIAFEYQNPYVTTYKLAPNRVEIILQGEAGMRIHLQTKMGGSEPSFRSLLLEDPLVCVGDCLDEHGLLLLEAINGKRDWFLDFEEALTAWKLIDPLQAYLQKPETPLTLYSCGEKGPKEVDEWIEREGYEWI
ncbi:MAG TPA: glucose-6-phosphate dehydrogenase [Candidatus Peribacterales bacterium]|nr:glucose-6-phosphate dehydrogenase [Candidatus Peribacterales bacterium]